MLMNNLDPGRRRAAGGPGGLRRQRQGRAELGLLRANRRHTPPARAMTKPYWSRAESPSASSGPTDEAPRVLIANSHLVPRWATWDEFRRLEALGLTMYGQMTAGSWIYIGTPGILQGTYETFAECARRRFRRLRSTGGWS